MKAERAIPFIRWCHRYRLRLQALLVLLGILLLVSILDSLSQTLLFRANPPQDGSLRMTPKHFEAPAANLLRWEQWHRFLENVTRGKPGILGQKWLYIACITLYAVLMIIVFLRLTPPDNSTQKQAEIPPTEKSKIED